MQAASSAIIDDSRTADALAVTVRWLDSKQLEASAVDALLAVLDDGERHRAARFRFERDRKAYIAAHALTRRLLAGAYPIAPQQLRFVTRRFGKPDLAADQNDRAVQFSLSHCASMVAVAMTFGADVGIDVESCGQLHWGELETAESFLSPSELAAVRSLPKDPRARTVASAWTLKEAFAKATGAGLSQSLDGLTIAAQPLSIGFAGPNEGDPNDWSFFQIQPDGEHLISLAINRADARLETGALAATSIRVPAGRSTE